jgi:endonuclease III-like uncharacterized protein
MSEMNEDKFLRMMEVRCGEECCECSITESLEEQIEELETEVKNLREIIQKNGKHYNEKISEYASEILRLREVIGLVGDGGYK